MATAYTPYRFKLRQRARSLRQEQTPAERKLWYEFLKHLPEKVTRQKPLGRFIADFYCASRRLVIEVDGDSHFNPGAAVHDAERDRELAKQDIRVLRFANNEVTENFGVCMAIRVALSEHAAES